MYEFLREARRGQLGVYLQFLVVLSMVAGGLVYAMAISGCDDCDESPETQVTEAQRATFQASIKGAGTGGASAAAAPGAQVTRVLGGDVVGGSGPGSVTYTYTPPEGATSFQFPTANPPDNPNGPSPYVWSNQNPSVEIEVKFNLPLMEGTYTEVLQAQHSDGSSSAGALNTTIGSSSASRLTDSGTVSSQASDDAWHVSPWIYTHGVTMTTELCQDWLDFLQGDNPFLAARMPMASPALTQSYPLPIIYGDVYSANLALLDERVWPHTRVFTVPAEYRPQRFQFLENELPSAPGEHWVALGLSSSPATACPSGLQLAPGDWEIKASIYLDLGADPQVLPIYFCYEGQSPPGVSAGQMAAAGAVQALGVDIGISSYQGQDITCVGPRWLHLRDSAHCPALSLYGSSAHYISPTETITLHHYLDVTTPMTVAFEYASTLGIMWDMYEGDWSGPNLSKPIASPIWVQQPEPHVWLVAEVPTSVDDGPHTLAVTATSVTSLGVSSTASDLMWVGAWVAPPRGGGDVYLPVVLRQSN